MRPNGRNHRIHPEGPGWVGEVSQQEACEVQQGKVQTLAPGLSPASVYAGGAANDNLTGKDLVILAGTKLSQQCALATEKVEFSGVY